MSVLAPERPEVAADGAERLRVAGGRTDRVRPGREAPGRPRPDLRPVERPHRRRSPAVPVVVGVGMVMAALFALAAMHALLINGQVRLDAMRRDVAAEQEAIRRLELQVAELESPDRVLDAARERLGMVQPPEVGYLLPAGIDGGTDAPVRVAPAEPEPVPEDDGPENDGPVSGASPDTDPEAAVPSADGPSADDTSTGDTGDGAVVLDDQPSEGGRDE